MSNFCSNPATSRCLPAVRKTLKLLEKAEAFLAAGRKLLDTEGITPPLRSTVCGLLDVRVVHHVCSKPDESRGQFKSLPAVGYAWVQELSSMLSRPVGCPADWAKSKAPEPAAPK